MPDSLPAKLIALVCATTLSLAPTLAHAGPPSSKEPPSQPQPDAPEPTPAPTPTVAPKVAEPPAPAVVVAPAPRVDDSLRLTGTNLWDGLHDSKVQVILKNEKQVSGTVVAQDAEQIAIARASDGTVVAVPKAEVQGVRLLATPGASTGDGPKPDLPPIADRPTDDGRRLYGAGVTMLSLGVPLGVAGTTLLGIFFYAPYIHLPVLLPGIGLIIGGSIALKRSHQRRDAFRKAWGLPGKTSKLQLTPTLGVGRNGGQLGVVMRF